MDSYSSIKISQLAEEDRPREKLLLKGKSSLTDAELIAILIGSGTPSVSAVDLSKHILAAVNYDLRALARLSIQDLKKFKGIGEAKAISIIAAMELARRRKDSEPVSKPVITCSQDIYELMKPELQDEQIEHFYLILLTRRNQVMRKHLVSQGGTAGTIVDAKIVFKIALEYLAQSVILIHNHPSGSLHPSDQDIKLTDRLVKVGRELDLPVLDHLIFTDVGYFSFADEGIL
ncbi:DNA repair protein RadC [Algoriphagus halophytocola]|uniref:DNA repair protein RadC n=1 Tax=Algoriphagus halophytocola TaxID=2991499 RepID=A0ABY6MLJ4_9BACT|nr:MULTISPECIES: DNA repair protein RadC [unclassified Algoriphagus]UZD24543.1 DNA repair protein RadC [Algoriphagus sp. TR-M5]WBL41907.1 DNA repair protein RadC [Algoriphagus sp. TR-M9]